MARGIWTRGRWSQLMKIWFGSDGEDEQTSVVVDESAIKLDEAPSASSSPSGGGKPKRDPKMSIVKKIGLALLGGGGSGSRDFEPPEFNFEDITNAYNTESYVRQAIDKYIEMMFKAGWGFVGKNPNAVEYVRMRFKLMAEATQIPTNQLFVEIAEDIVKYSNVVIAKKREDDPAIFAGLPVVGVGELAPIAGYFPLNITTMSVQRDRFGTIKRWQQEVDGQDKPVTYKPDDIVHIYYKREKGRAFGTPFLLPALDDIRALRQMEESVLRLVYRNLHPLWHIKVGIAEPELGAEDAEVDAVRNEVENMDVEGGLVTNERVEVKSIASNQIIDAKDYLKYFEQRVFTALGVSELMMGRGNTANRSTGDNLSGEFIDRVKAFQRILETFIDDFMIREILMEGGYDPVLNPDDMVNFTFYEIDMDSQIKKENQAVFLYEHNAITEDEMRQLIGRDPIEDGEQRSRMHLQLVTIATLEAEAALGGAAGGSASTDQDKKKAATDNKTKPANQHGVKSSPKKTTNSIEVRYLKEMFNEYSMLSDAVKTLVIRYHKEGGTAHLRTIAGAVAHTEGRFLEITEQMLGENIAQAFRVPYKRMLMDIRQKIADAIDMYGVEAASHSTEIAETVFDIFKDRLGAIATKALDTYAKEKEVEGNEEASGATNR